MYKWQTGNKKRSTKLGRERSRRNAVKAREAYKKILELRRKISGNSR